MTAAETKFYERHQWPAGFWNVCNYEAKRTVNRALQALPFENYHGRVILRSIYVYLETGCGRAGTGSVDQWVASEGVE